ncbi:PREDICTED: uncharacterized protein LOC108794535 [Nanorana parkeri]|uniref:uncharacterized protein LOC108794535 n=1 Tax=Nanorana parkeri TaxID=125878 RepID=UPI000854FA1D|nr:PREDICTED: uncharacterized protein LOC108794535 [Nanorana parkeri]
MEPLLAKLMDRTSEPEQRQDKSDGTAPVLCSPDGVSKPIRMPKFLSTLVMQNCDEDTTSRKRQKVFNGPLCSNIIPQHMYVTKQEGQRTDERFSSRDTVPPEGHSIPTEHYWATRSASRVTSLYAELVRELETQVSDLRQILVSRDEAVALREWRIQELEKENQELRRHIQTLEEQNDALSHSDISVTKEGGRLLGSDGNCVVINDNNISFLRSLAGFLETSYSSQSSTPQLVSTPIPTDENKHPSTERLSSPVTLSLSETGQPNSPAAVTSSPPEGMLRVSGVTSGFQYWMKMDDGGENAGPESCALWEEPLQETLPDGTPTWASPIESNGRPKLELVPASGVYITYQQLEDLSHIPPDKPKLMTRRLLDYFFSRETLARSSATGQRIAHNNTTMEKPLRLPDAVVTAIKAYVTRACGRGCNFNAVINSKCGTSRRAVKKMSIRIDWTEGGAKHCPKPATSPTQKLQCLSEKAPLPGTKGTDQPVSHNVLQTS